MSDRPAAFWASRTVGLAARALPRGEHRYRYRDEFVAELHGMSRPHQARHAISVLTHCWSLRSELASPPSTPSEALMTTSRDPLLCRTHAHHRWTLQVDPDGHRVLRCTRCGRGRRQHRHGITHVDHAPRSWTTGGGGAA